MTNHEEQHNIDTILEILEDEMRGDVQAALEKMHQDYSMTWVYKKGDKIFPAVTGEEVRRVMKDVYKIEGRTYEIKHIVAQANTVMAELIENYDNHSTPMVIVWEFEDGKIKTGRHYCDPQLSFEKWDKKDLYK